tara:strand:- start:1357 stop:1965 length:609 start_codon:yes stop_codon:yes gene_type:complete
MDIQLTDETEQIEQKAKKEQTRPKKRKKKHHGIYSRNLISRKIPVAFNLIGNNLNTILLKHVKKDVEGKCNKEGFIKNNSVRLVSISAGILEGENVIYHVSFECLICHPVENQHIKCKIVNITKAGIKCIYGDTEDESPIINYIARDHNYNNKLFNESKIGDVINTRVIGIRFELNDKKVYIISEIIQSRNRQKPNIVIKNK